MYRTAEIPSNTTSIDDLPDMSPEFQARIGRGENMGQRGENYINSNHQVPYQGGNHLRPDEVNMTRKFLRENHNPLPQSGMSSSDYMQMQQQQQQQQNNQRLREEVQNYQQPSYVQEQPRYRSDSEPSCLDINGHIENCPLCKKFYKQDKTIYLIIIAILSVLCVLMVKKILNL